MKNRTAMLLVLFLTVSVPAVLAEHDGGKCSHGKSDCAKASDCESEKGGCPIANKLMKKAGFYLKNASEIGLTEEQIKEIKAIKLEAEKDSILGAAQMQVAFLDIESKMSADPVDQEVLNATLDGLSAEMNQGAKKTVKLFADLKSILSAEQKKAAKALWNK